MEVSPNLKVTRIITRLNIGGPARHVGILNSGLHHYGFDSELIAGREAPSEGFLAAPGRTVSLPELGRSIAPVNDARVYQDLVRRMKARAPAIVHTHLAKAGALGRLAARRAGVPLTVHTFHGHVLEGYFSAPVNALFLRTERWLARSTDALIAVSNAVRDDLLELRVGRRDQWHVVPLGLNLAPLLDLDQKESREPVVGIVGRLTAIKDHATFMRAAEIVSRRHPSVRFVVAGDGEERPKIEEQASALHGRVRLEGWVNDLTSLYGSLDIVVLTSRNEGTPVALIEAGAAGRPVVATDVGGVSDVVRDEVTGFLATPGDAAGIAEKLLRLLDDADLRRSMGGAGRDWVRDRFSSARLVKETASLYEELLQRRRTAS